MSRLRESNGQAAVLTVVFLVVMLGFAAFVIDVGSWFHSRRTAQAAADAAVLAAAQALPVDPAGAYGLAVAYSAKNGITIAPGDVSITSSLRPNDTIFIHASRLAPTYFSKIFGISTVRTGATAAARIENIVSASRAAPIAVHSANPMLSGPGCPCFGAPATLPLDNSGAPGAFGLIDFDSHAGESGVSTLAGWLTSGYPGELSLGARYSDAGAEWNSAAIQDALASRVGSDLLFPVYDTLTGNGANAEYHTISWVAFYLTGFEARGSSGSISGYFMRTIWDGIQATAPGTTPDYGAYAIQLVN